MIIRVHTYLIGRETRCDVVIDREGIVGCSSEAYIDL